MGGGSARIGQRSDQQRVRACVCVREYASECVCVFVFMYAVARVGEWGGRAGKHNECNEDSMRELSETMSDKAS